MDTDSHPSPFSALSHALSHKKVQIFARDGSLRPRPFRMASQLSFGRHRDFRLRLQSSCALPTSERSEHGAQGPTLFCLLNVVIVRKLTCFSSRPPPITDCFFYSPSVRPSVRPSVLPGLMLFPFPSHPIPARSLVRALALPALLAHVEGARAGALLQRHRAID